MKKYTTEYDQKLAEGIAFQRAQNVDEEFILARVESIVSAAVLVHVKENLEEGSPKLINFHASLGPNALDTPLSELVDHCIETMSMRGTPIEDVDSHLESMSLDDFLKETSI